MAITINWGTKVISVPKTDTQLVQSVPTEIRQLDLDQFRLTLKDLEDNADGMPHPRTHNHNPPVTVGGVTLARVVEIINGYTVTFEDDQYAVNLVGANSNVSDTANVNQVSIRSANSAGLTFSDQINEQSYFGAVWIDTVSGLSGTQFPRGTPTDPVDNYADAEVIEERLNLRDFRLNGTITPATDIDNHYFTGRGYLNSAVILNGLISTSSAGFARLALSGTGAGSMQLEDCRVESLADFEGYMDSCAILGPVTVSSAATGIIRVLSCFSDVPGTSRPEIDMNGAAASLSVRGYHGGLTVGNVTQGSHSIDVDSGTLEIAATCTGGTINVRGVVSLIDNSGVGCTVVTSGTVTELAASGSITEQDKVDIAGKVIPHVWASSG